MSIKNLLQEKMTKSELSLVPSSFDIIGNKDKAVAIVEIPEALKKRQKLIANAIMQQHKNVKSVLRKTSPRKGVFRTREYKLIAGEKNTEVLHVESGCRFLVDPRKAYFSQREGQERLRIVSMTKEGEVVMVFFAGIGPLPILIAKKSKPKKVIGIEINPNAGRYFWKNIAINKTNNVEVVIGDVHKKAKKYYGKCNRVLMPLPESADKFLEEAISCCKKGGVVHFYCFCAEKEIAKKKKLIRSAAKKLKRKILFIGTQRVLPYGPKIWKTRVDFEVD